MWPEKNMTLAFNNTFLCFFFFTGADIRSAILHFQLYFDDREVRVGRPQSTVYRTLAGQSVPTLPGQTAFSPQPAGYETTLTDWLQNTIDSITTL